MANLIFIFFVSNANSVFGSLPGLLTSDCLPFGRHATLSTLSFSEGEFRAIGDFFERPGCGVRTLRVNMSGRYSKGGSYGSGIEFDYIPTSMTLTLLLPEILSHYNQKKICGFSNWKLNEKKEITGSTNCVGFQPPKVEVPLYEIYSSITTDSVKFSFFPNVNFNSDPTKRPKTISEDAALFWTVSEESFNRVLREELSPRLNSMDSQNTSDLKGLIRIHKWFKISEFGVKADINAWLIVQHADLDREFQKSVLATLEKLWRSAETSPSNFAYLHDRVSASWNNPTKRVLQTYGTQGMCIVPGRWEPIPIKDSNKVNDRRKEVGLGSLEDQIKLMNSLCK